MSHIAEDASVEIDPAGIRSIHRPLFFEDCRFVLARRPEPTDELNKRFQELARPSSHAHTIALPDDRYKRSGRFRLAPRSPACGAGSSRQPQRRLRRRWRRTTRGLARGVECAG